MCNIMCPNRVHPNHGGCRNSHSERRRGLEATIELKALQGDHGTTGTAGAKGAAELQALQGLRMTTGPQGIEAALGLRTKGDV